MRIKKQYTCSKVTKNYLITDLLDFDWQSRVELIEQISSSLTLIPKISFTQTVANELLYHQQLVVKERCPKESILAKLQCLALELDDFSATGLVHGDICYKNILYDGFAFRLVDLEPSFNQIRNGRSVLLYTPPYIALDDYKNNNLTSATDKVGFYFFCKRLLDPIINFSPRRLMKNIECGESLVQIFTGINEAEFIEMNYESIFKIFVGNYR